MQFRITLTQVGVREKTGHNDGEVEKYLRVVGLPRGNPYCAAGIVWSFKEAQKRVGGQVPIAVTPLAYGLYADAKRRSRRIGGAYRSRDLVVWKHSNSINGHVEQIVRVADRGWVVTQGYNTSADAGGDQRDGGGVYLKRRNFKHPLGRMRLQGFVGFYY